MFDKSNPMISASMRTMRWEIAINFPNCRNDPSMEDYIRDWTHHYMVEKMQWNDKVIRDQMVDTIMEDMFGSKIDA